MFDMAKPFGSYVSKSGLYIYIKKKTYTSQSIKTMTTDGICEHDFFFGVCVMMMKSGLSN